MPHPSFRTWGKLSLVFDVLVFSSTRRASPGGSRHGPSDCHKVVVVEDHSVGYEKAMRTAERIRLASAMLTLSLMAALCANAQQPAARKPISLVMPTGP